MIRVNKPLFPLGKMVATPGAIEAMQKAGQSPWEFLAQHVQGQWGVVSAEDKAANDVAVTDGSRILSAFLLNDGQTKIWVITEAANDQEQRVATTILLGLGPVEQQYLRILAEGASRLNVIASRLGLPSRTVAEVTEPFLIRAGLLVKDDQGRRELTAQGREHLATRCD